MQCVLGFIEFVAPSLLNFCGEGKCAGRFFKRLLNLLRGGLNLQTILRAGELFAYFHIQLVYRQNNNVISLFEGLSVQLGRLAVNRERIRCNETW